MTGAGVKQKRQLFPEKLWDLVNNQPSSGIYWSKNGKRIEIDRSQLEKFLQTKLLDTFRNTTPSSPSSSSSLSSTNVNTKFRSHNFDSFIRQLHFYGFKKTGNSYYHDRFQRDKPDALYTMKRKYSSLPLSGNQTISTMLPQATITTRQLSQQSALSVSRPSLLSQSITGNKSLNAGDSNRIAAKTLTSLNSTLEDSSPTEQSYLLESSPTTTESFIVPTLTNAGYSSADTIKMYTIDSSACDDGQLSFTNVRETSVKAIRDEKSVKICIPNLMLNNHSDDSWPKTLVLENQNILSAYFIYKLN